MGRCPSPGCALRLATTSVIDENGYSVTKDWTYFTVVFKDKDRVDLSDAQWQSGVGKAALECYLAKELHGCLTDVLHARSEGCLREASRWSSSRRERLTQLQTPPSGLQDWPDDFNEYRKSSGPFGLCFRDEDATGQCDES